MSVPYRSYMLVLLTSILTFNYVDRLALGLVLENIKASFHLHDWQLGLLTGLAFALFYSAMGLPIARWADRGNRRVIIGLTTGLWSVAVALCGFAASFPQLLLCRVGVAVGEAGCMPPGHSLIADYYSRKERPGAVAVYMLGSTLSVLIGYLVAGWLSTRFGWRGMFRYLALPGLLLSPLAWFTLREPRADHAVDGGRHAAGPSVVVPTQYTVTQTFATLWRNATFRNIWLNFSVMSFFGYGVAQWQPSYFRRSFGMPIEELGVWLTVIYGVGGTVGTYVGGVLAGRYAANNEKFQLQATSILYAGYSMLMVGVFLCRDKYTAIALNTLGVLATSLVSGPLFGTIQTVVPERMRAMSITVLYLFANLVGLGLGPLLTGALSDALAPRFGEDSLRYALLALCPVALWGSYYLMLAARTVSRDIDEVTAADDAARARLA